MIQMHSSDIFFKISYFTLFIIFLVFTIIIINKRYKTKTIFKYQWFKSYRGISKTSFKKK